MAPPQLIIRELKNENRYRHQTLHTHSFNVFVHLVWGWGSYQTAICDLRFFSHLVEKIVLSFLSKTFSFLFKKWNICERTLDNKQVSSRNVKSCQVRMSSRNFENWQSVAIFKKAAFRAIPGDIGFLSFFSNSGLKSLRMVFFAFFVEIWTKKRIAPRKPKIWISTFFISWHQMTLTWGYQRPKRVLRSTKTQFNSFQRLYFSLIRLLCSEKSVSNDSKKSGPWPDLWRHQWP